MKSTSWKARKKASASWKPHSYQVKGCKWMLKNGAAFILWDPGLGKTSATLAVTSALKHAGIITKTLVIAPLRVCQLVWPAEVRKWKDFENLQMVVLHGPDKEELLQSPHDVAVINPDGLEWLFKHKKLPYQMLVVDESTQFKNTKAKRFKLLKTHLNDFQRRYCLTGTPASNGLEDLFGQVYILDGGASLGRFITHYRLQYFDAGGFGGHERTPKIGAEERIYEAIAPLAHRLDARDHLKLPKLITTPDTDIYIELPPAARRRYDEMEELFLTQLSNGSTVTAFNAAVKSGKLRQIAAGGLFYQDESGRWENFHEAKIDALEELHDSLAGRPMLVGIEFQHDLDRLRKRFGKDFPAIVGGTPEKRVKELEYLWNLGRLPMLAGHPKSMGHGLNLQKAANVVCWLTTTWSLELYEQFYRRVWRQGNDADKVFNYHIIARDTVDEAVMLALREHAFTQNALLSALKKYSLTRR